MSAGQAVTTGEPGPKPSQALEQAVLHAIRQNGPRATFHNLIHENDARIWSPELTGGRKIAAERTAIYTALVGDWAAEQRHALGYHKPFAVVAVGGTGRAEMAPFSDNDFAFLFDDALEGNPFLLELQRQILHTNAFADRCGFVCLALPFSLDDVPSLSGKQLNSFLDMRAVYDPHGLANVFRERIRATFDPFEHFLHVRGFWKEHWEKAAAESERLDRFDIKNEGLRVFLAGIWTLAGRSFVHSHEIYEQLTDARDLDAYDLLIRIRAFIHLRHRGAPQPSTGGNHPEDILGFEEFLSFGELLAPEADQRARFEFANDVRARLLSARRRVAQFAKGVIERELKDGRRVGPGNPIVFGVGGLHHETAAQCLNPHEKSRAALSLLLAAQRYGVPIDPAELQGTFRQAGDWLVPVPELSALFYEQRGSLADSFTFLSQFDGAMERLFPGYARFETSIDDRVLAERKSLRSVLERRKLQILDQYVREGQSKLASAISVPQLTDPDRGIVVSIEAALLDADHLAAVKLALKTKRLPLTPADLAMRGESGRPFHTPYASGFSEIPLADYYARFHEQCDFAPQTLRLVEFLLANRRAFKERAEVGINDRRQVEEFARLCGDEHKLRALFVFTCADRAEWESEGQNPVRWFNTRELYSKSMSYFRPATDRTRILATAGYTPDESAVLRDFGDDFFGGVYRPYALKFGTHLLRLVEEPEFSAPKVSLLRDGAATIMGIAARDYRGLAATISGALWHQNVLLHQAHLFSAAHHRLALDFFHVAPRDNQPLPLAIEQSVEEAIQKKLFIANSDEDGLPHIEGTASLREWRHGLHCLRFETASEAAGLVYVLTYRIFRHLRGDIFGLSAHATRERAFVSVYHRLPGEMTLEQAQAIVAREF